MFKGNVFQIKIYSNTLAQDNWQYQAEIHIVLLYIQP